MLDDVIKRLASFGCVVEENEKILLEFIISKVENNIKNDCGVYDKTSSSIVIPDELHEIAVDMVCGEYLKEKKSTGSLAGFDLSPAVKSIQEGDTTVTFKDASLTSEQRLDALINYLLNSGKGVLVSHRCIRW